MIEIFTYSWYDGGILEKDRSFTMANTYKTITPQQAKRIMETEECLILDVREEDEYIIEHIENAELLTLATINEKNAAEVIPSKDTLLLVYCRSGKRSHTASHMLAQLGYTRVHDFGGIIDWPYELTWE